jgi:serine/threonine protein kinase
MMKCPTCGARYSAAERLCPKDGAVLEHEQPLDKQLIGKTLDGKYRLESFISRGGMGAVFRGTHVMLNRPVAVKLINANLVTSPEIVRRFQREARAATQLNHANIVDVYDLGQTAEGTLYIVMELVTGHSLKQEIRTHGPFEAARIVHILAQVCDGLAAAHRANIVHRDLKPQNIMLTHDHSGAEVAKIVDFGIAKTFEVDSHTQLTAEGATLGTPHYMSPEQATGREVDGRSDIYSLGIILYEMLTGEVPFDDRSMAGLLIKHMSETPTTPSKKRPELQISPALEAVALRCLAKDPGARYATAADMRAALRSAALEEGVTTPSNAAAAGVVTVPRAAATPLPPLPVMNPTANRPATHPTAPALTPTMPSGAAPAVPYEGVTTRSSRGPALLVAAFLVLLSVAALAGYWLWSRGSDTTEPETVTTDSAPPATSPASGTPDTASPTTPQPPEPSPSALSESLPDTTAPPPNTAPSSPETADRRTTPAPTASAASGTAQSAATARAQGAPSAPAPSAPSAPARGTSAPGAPAPGARSAPNAPSAPSTPSVSFQCRGASEICAPLRAEMESSFERAGLSMRRSGADINITAEATHTDQTSQRAFGTTLNVNTYSVQLDAESPRLDNEVISMPSPPPVSADPRVGTERFNEYARKIAPDVVERVQAFWAKRRP